jgi:hypothetical protein
MNLRNDPGGVGTAVAATSRREGIAPPDDYMVGAVLPRRIVLPGLVGDW